MVTEAGKKGPSPNTQSEPDLDHLKYSGSHGDFLETQFLDSVFLTWLGLEWSLLSGDRFTRDNFSDSYLNVLLTVIKLEKE